MHIFARWYDFLGLGTYVLVSSTALLKLDPVTEIYAGKTPEETHYLNIQLAQVAHTGFWTLVYHYPNIPEGPPFFQFTNFFISDLKPFTEVYREERTSPKPGYRTAYMTP